MSKKTMNCSLSKGRKVEGLKNKTRISQFLRCKFSFEIFLFLLSKTNKVPPHLISPRLRK